MKAYEPDLQIVVAFRKLPKSVWSLPTKGTINLHASLLPDYRGAAPINWAIINGETKTGVTTFYINDQLDTGLIIYQESVEIKENELAGELHDKLSEVGGDLVLKTAEVIQKGQPSLKEQTQISNPKKAPKINKADCRIDWHDIVDNVHNFIRGLSPFPGAWTTWQGTNIKIFRTEKENNQVIEQPGTLLPLKSQLKVAAKDGCINILELQPEGSRKMDSGSFLNGFSIPAGSRFE
ncbi:MAG: methionyl-tRNA formyltransferase [Bacteroidetes bacterium SW_10_40_5]|nr:MAG: methionyl-tRNA formyltransferase [Bacteroidetes bacterium SW_10_40_5]